MPADNLGGPRLRLPADQGLPRYQTNSASRFFSHHQEVSAKLGQSIEAQITVFEGRQFTRLHVRPYLNCRDPIKNQASKEEDLEMF